MAARVTRLTPTSVHIETNLKLFGLEKGESWGSTLGFTFSIPEDMDPKEIKTQIFYEKEQIDLIVGTMEMAHGSFGKTQYEAWKARLRSIYDRLLGRPPTPPPPAPAKLATDEA